MIDRALDRDPGNLSFLYHKAKILLSSGDAEAAIRLLEELRIRGTEFAEKQEALKLLAELSR